LPINEIHALEIVVIDFETKPDSTPIQGGILTQAEPNGLIEDLGVDGEPYFSMFESLGVRFGNNDLVYGRVQPPLFVDPSIFNLMGGNSGQPAEGLGQALTDEIDIFFIHPVTKNPRTVQSVEMLVVDPEDPLTVTAFDIDGIQVDLFSNPCLNCSFTASVSSAGGIAHVLVSMPGPSTYGIDDLTFEQEPIVPVGGIFEGVDTISLLLNYAILNAIWIAPLGIGIGVGIYLVKRKF